MILLEQKQTAIKTALILCVLCCVAFAQGQRAIVRGVIAQTITDSRDGKTYRIVVMPDDKTWMAENLNYQTGNSWCYGDDNSNCDKYGRLYDWNTAKGACPAGWRLPTDDDWGALVKVTGGNEVAGTKLKSATGWEQDSNTPTGTDDFGFSALPGGIRYTAGSFSSAGYYGYWWSATEYDGSRAQHRSMGYNVESVGSYWSNKSFGFSVRCSRD